MSERKWLSTCITSLAAERHGSCAFCNRGRKRVAVVFRDEDSQDVVAINLAYRKLTQTVSVDPKQLSRKRPDKTHHCNRLHRWRHRNIHHPHRILCHLHIKNNCRHLTQHEVQKFHNCFTKDDPTYGSTVTIVEVQRVAHRQYFPRLWV